VTSVTNRSAFFSADMPLKAPNGSYKLNGTGCTFEHTHANQPRQHCDVLVHATRVPAKKPGHPPEGQVHSCMHTRAGQQSQGRGHPR